MSLWKRCLGIPSAATASGSFYVPAIKLKM